MPDPVIMGLVGDLFPRQVAPPEQVASVMVEACPVASYRNAPSEVQELIRVAAAWQGGASEPKSLLGRVFDRAPQPPVGEADFVAAARRVYERFG